MMVPQSWGYFEARFSIGQDGLGRIRENSVKAGPVARDRFFQKLSAFRAEHNHEVLNSSFRYDPQKFWSRRRLLDRLQKTAQPIDNLLLPFGTVEAIKLCDSKTNLRKRICLLGG